MNFLTEREYLSPKKRLGPIFLTFDNDAVGFISLELGRVAVPQLLFVVIFVRFKVDLNIQFKVHSF